MIKIDITNNGYFVRGHADYDEYGYDIVCSAVSALTQAIALSLEKDCGAKVEKTLNGLVVEIDKPNDKTNLLLRALILGLSEIEIQYPNNVEVRKQKGMI